MSTAYTVDELRNFVKLPEDSKTHIFNLENGYSELQQQLTDCQAKLDAATKIISAAKDFDAASEDAEWEPPHPIFMMAQENDDLRAKLKRYEDAFSKPYAWESDNQGEESFITKERHDALSCSSNGILKELFTKPEGE
jgi:isopenicillin N synthase-like dioxygenase